MQTKAFTKTEIRNTVRTARAQRSHAERSTLTHGFTRQLIALHTQYMPKIVACYLSQPGEPHTTPYIDWAHAHGTTILLPLSNADHTLSWAEYAGQENLRTGAFNILEPVSAPISHSAATLADLMLIPACAIDHTGARLGWGRGYFDRCLSERPTNSPTYAVIHEDEFLTRVPREPHDQPVNGVVTPERWVPLPLTTPPQPKPQALQAP